MNQKAIDWICSIYGCFNPRAHEDVYKAYIAGRNEALEEAAKLVMDESCAFRHSECEKEELQKLASNIQKLSPDYNPRYGKIIAEQTQNQETK